MSGPGLSGQYDVDSTLSEYHQHRHFQRAHDDPGRRRHLHRNGSGHNAQHEPKTDQHGVEYHDSFRAQRVHDVDRQVQEDHEEKQKPDRQTDNQRGTDEHDRQARRKRQRDTARRDWPMLAMRMLHIGVSVFDVVAQVDRARCECEGNRSGQCRQQPMRVRNTGEDSAAEHEKVLHPLRRTDALDDVAHHRVFLVGHRGWVSGHAQTRDFSVGQPVTVPRSSPSRPMSSGSCG